MAERSSPSSRGVTKWLTGSSIGLALALYTAVFVVYGLVVPQTMKSWERSGQFGDMFGTINAFASALALFGILATILLQREDIEQAAVTQKESIDALLMGVYAQTYLGARAVLQEERVREARGFVVDTLKTKPFPWTRTEIQQAEIVCHTFDTVGQMVRYQMLPANYVVDSWRQSLIDSWHILSPLVGRYRRERGFPGLWDDFEYLAKAAQQAATSAGRLTK